jgi:hypothetical protein
VVLGQHVVEWRLCCLATSTGVQLWLRVHCMLVELRTAALGGVCVCAQPVTGEVRTVGEVGMVARGNEVGNAHLRVLAIIKSALRINFRDHSRSMCWREGEERQRQGSSRDVSIAWVLNWQPGRRSPDVGAAQYLH